MVPAFGRITTTTAPFHCRLFESTINPADGIQEKRKLPVLASRHMLTPPLSDCPGCTTVPARWSARLPAKRSPSAGAGVGWKRGWVVIHGKRGRGGGPSPTGWLGFAQKQTPRAWGMKGIPGGREGKSHHPFGPSFRNSYRGLGRTEIGGAWTLRPRPSSPGGCTPAARLREGRTTDMDHGGGNRWAEGGGNQVWVVDALTLPLPRPGGKVAVEMA